MQNLEILDVFRILITQKLLKCPKDPFVRSALKLICERACWFVIVIVFWACAIENNIVILRKDLLSSLLCCVYSLFSTTRQTITIIDQARITLEII